MAGLPACFFLPPSHSEQTEQWHRLVRNVLKHTAAGTALDLNEIPILRIHRVKDEFHHYAANVLLFSGNKKLCLNKEGMVIVTLLLELIGENHQA